MRTGISVFFIHPVSPGPSTVPGTLKALNEYVLTDQGIDWQFHKGTKSKQGYNGATLCRMVTQAVCLSPTHLSVLEFSAPVLLSALQHSRTWTLPRSPSVQIISCCPTCLRFPNTMFSSKWVLVLWASPPFHQWCFPFIAKVLVLSCCLQITKGVKLLSRTSCQSHPFRSQELPYCLSHPPSKLLRNTSIMMCIYEHWAGHHCRWVEMSKMLFLDLWSCQNSDWHKTTIDIMVLFSNSGHSRCYGSSMVGSITPSCEECQKGLFKKAKSEVDLEG